MMAIKDNTSVVPYRYNGNDENRGDLFMNLSKAMNFNI